MKLRFQCRSIEESLSGHNTDSIWTVSFVQETAFGIRETTASPFAVSYHVKPPFEVGKSYVVEVSE